MIVLLDNPPFLALAGQLFAADDDRYIGRTDPDRCAGEVGPPWTLGLDKVPNDLDVHYVLDNPPPIALRWLSDDGVHQVDLRNVSAEFDARTRQVVIGSPYRAAQAVHTLAADDGTTVDQVLVLDVGVQHFEKLRAAVTTAGGLARPGRRTGERHSLSVVLPADPDQAKEVQAIVDRYEGR